MPCKNHPMAEERLVECARCAESFCPDCVVELKGAPYCADCKTEQIKDVQSGTDNSELELAGIGARFAALILDGLIMGIPVFGIAFGMALLLGRNLTGGVGPMVVQIIIGLLASIPIVVYEGLMLSSRGQTLGKMALKIKVVTPEGNDISAGQAWGRCAVRCFFNQLSGIGVLINYLPAFSKRRTCVHDMALKTRVIKWR